MIDAYRAAGDAEIAIDAHPEFARHIKKIENSDYSFPVFIFESKMIDGMHRFAKAILEDQATIKAKIIDEMPKEAIINMRDKNSQ